MSRKVITLESLERFKQKYDALVNRLIADATTTLYRPKGSKTVAELNTLTNVEVGDVYNVTDSGTLIAGNVQVNAGDNVVWVEENNVGSWDVLSGIVDLSNYLPLDGGTLTDNLYITPTTSLPKYVQVNQPQSIQGDAYAKLTTQLNGGYVYGILETSDIDGTTQYGSSKIKIGLYNLSFPQLSSDDTFAVVNEDNFFTHSQQIIADEQDICLQLFNNDSGQKVLLTLKNTYTAHANSYLGIDDEEQPIFGNDNSGWTLITHRFVANDTGVNILYFAKRAIRTNKKQFFLIARVAGDDRYILMNCYFNAIGDYYSVSVIAANGLTLDGSNNQGTLVIGGAGSTFLWEAWE